MNSISKSEFINHVLVILRAMALALSLCFWSTSTSADSLQNLRNVVIEQFGPALMPDQVAQMGQPFDAYENLFAKNAMERMQEDGVEWEESDYYDRAKIFYVYYSRSGDERYLHWANEISLNYRQNYLEQGGYSPSAHWSQMGGVYLNYLFTHDAMSKQAVLRVAELFSLPYYLENIGDVSAEMDNRIQARTVLALLYAYKIEREEKGKDAETTKLWAARLRKALDGVLKSQSSDGSYRFMKLECDGVKPFMLGLLNDALIDYYTNFEQDERLLLAVKKSLDYIWTNLWVSSQKAFLYRSNQCRDETAVPAPDLNMLLVSGFGFVYSKTGDVRYVERGDLVFRGGIEGAWLGGSKVFNENFFSSYRYPAYVIGSRIIGKPQTVR